MGDSSEPHENPCVGEEGDNTRGSNLGYPRGSRYGPGKGRKLGPNGSGFRGKETKNSALRSVQVNQLGEGQVELITRHKKKGGLLDGGTSSRSRQAGGLSRDRCLLQEKVALEKRGAEGKKRSPRLLIRKRASLREIWDRGRKGSFSKRADIPIKKEVGGGGGGREKKPEASEQ